jgi:Na+-transporting NADH:ubiquinone oxidoreductase subunit C
MAESIGRTMLTAVAIALVCSAMVSGAVYYLRPIQAGTAALERMAVVVSATGGAVVDANEATTRDEFALLEARIYDFESEAFAAALAIDPRLFDHWSPGPASLSRPPDEDADAVGLDQLPRYVPVYIDRQNGVIHRVILPFHGRGMWSTIYGYIALGPDLNTVSALRFYRHGETPGIGDRILRPDWLETWVGKRIFDRSDARGEVMIEVSDDPSIGDQHRVDAISGATVTAKAVSRSIRYWFGPGGYGTLLDALAREGTR